MLGSLYKTAVGIFSKFGLVYSEATMSLAIKNNDETSFEHHINSGIQPTQQHLKEAIETNNFLFVLKIMPFIKSFEKASITAALNSSATIQSYVVTSLVKENRIEELELFAKAGYAFTADNLGAFSLNSETLEWLKDKGIKYDRQALRRAIRRGKADFVKEIASSQVPILRADIESALDEKTSVLGESIPEVTRAKMAISLIEAGAEVESGDLMKALNLDSEELAIKILDKLKNFTPDLNILKYAAFRGHERLIDRFMKLGSDLDEDTMAILYMKNVKLYKKYLAISGVNDEFKIVRILAEKGNYSAAKRMLSSISSEASFDPLEMLTDALLRNFEDNVEWSKWPALLNLLAKSVELSSEQKRLLDISLYSKYEEFSRYYDNKFERYNFIFGLIHKLAEHHIYVTKQEIAKSIKSSSLDLLDIVFSKQHSISDKFRAALKIREQNPENPTFSKLDSPFDIMFLTVGEPISRINHLFAIEVLGVSGVYPNKRQENLRTFRGMMANLSDDDLEDFFRYGLHSFSPGYYQKNLSFYYNSNMEGTFKGRAQTHYELGGVYVSVEPFHSVQYALGLTSRDPNTRRLFIESVLRSGNAQIFGFSSNEYELAPAQISSDEILCVYELDPDGKVIRQYRNTNFFDKTFRPSFEIGMKIERDENAANLFNRIFSPMIMTHENRYEGRDLRPELTQEFYREYPELPNQVSVSPNALSELRLDQDVLAFQCLDDRFTQFVMHSSLPEVEALQPAPLPITPDSGVAIIPATASTSTALRAVEQSIEDDEVAIPAALQTYELINAIQHTTATIRLAQCVWRGAQQFTDYFSSVAQSVISSKVEHKYVRQLQENGAEVLRYIKKVGKELDRKEPQNTEAFTEEALKIERKINGRSSFTQKQMKEIIDDLIDLYKDAKHVAKDWKFGTLRGANAAQNLKSLASDISKSQSR